MVYSTPIITKRPPKSDRFDLFSPKLNRHITLFSYWQLQLWIMLETFPCINSFCERPNFIELKNGKQQLIDFWLLRVRSETLLVILNDGVSSLELAKPTQLPISYIRPSLFNRWPYLTKNWQSMLPYLVAQKHWLDDGNIVKVKKQCDRPMTLAQLEIKLSNSDQTQARSTVFAALAKGFIKAPSLKKEPWTPGMLVIPNHCHDS